MEKIHTAKVQYFTKVIGSLALVKAFLKKMQIAKIVDEICPSDPQQKVSHGKVVELLVANRLSSPTPLYEVEKWAEEVEVERVYGIPAHLLNDDRSGDTLDHIYSYLPVFKGEIARSNARRFQVGLDYLHWDLTTFYFEGDYENQNDDYIKICYAKDKASQMAQKAAKVGLNVANDGKGPVPVFYESLNGNAQGFEVTHQNMENLKKYLKVDRIVRISDRGCFSAKVVAETKRNGFELISSVKVTNEHFKLLRLAIEAGNTFQRLPYLSQNQARKNNPEDRDGYSGLDVSHELIYGGRPYPVRFIFVRSDGKIKRDNKKRQKHISRIELELLDLQRRVGKRRLKDPSSVEGGVKGIIGKYPEGKYLKWELEVKGDKVDGLNFFWDKDGLELLSQRDGLYLLCTTLPEDGYSLERVFQLFKEQHYSESANKFLKGPIKLRPIFLHNQRRIESLLFISVLALMVYMLIERHFRNQVKEEKLKKITTRTLLKAFHNYSMTVMVNRALLKS